MRWRCHLPGWTWRRASQSGKRPCIESTWKPSSPASTPKRKITPNSLIGAFASGKRLKGGPRVGRAGFEPALTTKGTKGDEVEAGASRKEPFTPKGDEGDRGGDTLFKIAVTAGAKA